MLGLLILESFLLLLEGNDVLLDPADEGSVLLLALRIQSAESLYLGLASSGS